MSALIRGQLNGAAVTISRSLVARSTSASCIISTAACRRIATASTSVNDSRQPPSVIPPLTNVQKTTSTLPNQQLLQQQLSPRREAVQNAKPFSEFLTDNFNRQHTYLRISITERCNLRCVYCMPEEGVPLTPDSKLLSTPEILHIANLFVSQGVTKIRLTGGEPTIRKDIIELVTELGKLKSKGLKELAITSNGIVLAKKLEKMVQGGLTAVNLSLDTLEPWKFEIMTRRKGLENVLKTIDKALELEVQPLKVNCVVMRGVNDYEIPKFVKMTQEMPVEVRFIEYMPFDGNKWNENKMVPFSSMLSQIQTLHPNITKVADQKNETSKTYQIPGFPGKIGFITSMTHNFCGTCNRLRVTSDGNLKVCLFGNEEVSLRDMMRESEARKEIVMDGGVGLMQDVREKERIEMERQMLEVIGVAVKGKREKHAGMGDLEHMKNRPMILIGG
ncbi:hypothetical protein EV426DRAFT_534414 [Tirmania nivea]|nr:hypothetical protein EV426DRAFT_534414 [Tirmania nivea]